LIADKKKHGREKGKREILGERGQGSEGLSGAGRKSRSQRKQDKRGRERGEKGMVKKKWSRRSPSLEETSKGGTGEGLEGGGKTMEGAKVTQHKKKGE